MSNYTIEISGNQPYYVEVDNSTLQDVVNLTAVRDNDVNIEVSTSNTLISFEFPSGYPIEATSGNLPYTRVDGLGSYIETFTSDSQKTTFKIKNICGHALYAGQSVYMSGIDPSELVPTVQPFVANGIIPEHLFLGLVNSNISNDNYGYITFFGEISSLDTRGNVTTNIAVGDESWSVGDLLYAHPTELGKLTNIKPRHSILVAITLNISSSIGKLLVRPLWNQHLSDLHDVNISGVLDGNLLKYNSTGNIWNSSNDIDGGIV